MQVALDKSVTKYISIYIKVLFLDPIMQYGIYRINNHHFDAELGNKSVHDVHHVMMIYIV